MGLNEKRKELRQTRSERNYRQLSWNGFMRALTVTYREKIPGIFRELINNITALNRRLRIIASIGISSYPEYGEAIEMLLKHSDIAKYYIKATGRDDYKRYGDG
jgi:GGDEF domain-containing protein